MARQKGLIRPDGTIDDLTFYKLNGEYIMRKKSGFPSGKKRKNKKYKKTVENQSDFGKASHTATAIRRLLYKYINASADKSHYYRFNTPIVRILRQDMDMENRGKRQFTGRDYTPLAGFHFNAAAAQATNANFILKHSIDVESNTAYLSGTLYQNPQITSCTHVQISQLVLLFNLETKAGQLFSKDELIAYNAPVAFTTQMEFPSMADKPLAMHLVCLHYFQGVNGALYPVHLQFNNLVVLEGKGVFRS